MQSPLKGGASVRGEGKIYFGAGDGKLGVVDTRDIADAAVAAATSDAWDGQTLERTGPVASDYHTVAAAVGLRLPGLRSKRACSTEPCVGWQ